MSEFSHGTAVFAGQQGHSTEARQWKFGDLLAGCEKKERKDKEEMHEAKTRNRGMASPFSVPNVIWSNCTCFLNRYGRDKPLWGASLPVPRQVLKAGAELPTKVPLSPPPAPGAKVPRGAKTPNCQVAKTKRDASPPQLTYLIIMTLVMFPDGKNSQILSVLDMFIRRNTTRKNKSKVSLRDTATVSFLKGFWWTE